MELPSEQDLNPFSRYEALGRPNRPIVLDDVEVASDCPPAEKSPSDEGFTELELLQNDSGTENGSTETSQSRHETGNTACLSLEEASMRDLSDSVDAITSVQTAEAVRSCDANQAEDVDEGLHNRSTDENVEPVLYGEKKGTLYTGRAELNKKGQMVTAVDEMKDAKSLNKAKILIRDSSKVEEVELAEDQKRVISTADMARDNISGPNDEDDKETIKKPKAEELNRKEEDVQNHETEMSWLMKRMQGPIEGRWMYWCVGIKRNV